MTTETDKGKLQEKSGQTSEKSDGKTSGQPDEATQKIISDKLAEQGRVYASEKKALTDQLTETQTNLDTVTGELKNL